MHGERCAKTSAGIVRIAGLERMIANDLEANDAVKSAGGERMDNGPTLEELSERNHALLCLDGYVYRRVKNYVDKVTLNLRRWFWALVERVGSIKGEVDEHGQRIKDLERKQRNMEIAIKALKRKKGRDKGDEL